MSRLLVALIVAALAPAAAGCGLGPGEAKTGGVELRVTRDFGQRELGAPARMAKLRDSDTVMRFLQGSRKVATRFGGGFVQSIAGLQGNQTAEHDWFYFVNGSEASVGAADYKLSPGDVVQWDYRNWHATQHVPAIVGAYPEPFVHGMKGKRLPTRVECEQEDSKPCTEVGDSLAKYGANVTSAPLGSPSTTFALRVIVAKFSTVSRIRAITALESGPATTGVYARFNAAGTGLDLLGDSGAVARTAPPGTGLLAATQPPAQAITWVVTGVDDAGVQRAAAALDPAKLRDAFAVAVTPTGIVKLPVGAR
ncbi:MAG: hypothetical protein QOC95_1989 [Thermoleophilaceae bacterium]|nr:hypothetical protein [Thermoleophilaceae bacterium]